MRMLRLVLVLVMAFLPMASFAQDAQTLADIRAEIARLQQRESRLQALADDGLLTFTRVGFQATPRGRLLLRVIAMCFDRYLPTAAASTPRFSRTV